MNYFEYRNGQLYAEDVDLTHIAATIGTPCYIYSRKTIERHWHAFNNALRNQSHLICYAVKANSNIALLNILARLGSGFDIVSGGELQRVLKAGGDPQKVVFSGVGKTAEEMRLALTTGIYCFNVESAAELEQLNSVATELGTVAPISLRINPDVDAKTHPYISTGLKDNKFGIGIDTALELYERASKMKAIKILGVDCHIGSQLTEVSPFADALERLLIIIDELDSRNIKIEHLDIGGGLGISYQDEAPPTPDEYADAIINKIKGRNLKIILEPGRAIVGNAGILLTRILYLKHSESKNFAIIDAAMNDLLRPSLYKAWQNIIPVTPRNQGESKIYDIVGPVCETGDFLGKDRSLNIASGDLLAVCSSGAYGFSMSSNYNTRPRAAEVLVDGLDVHVIRKRETVEDLMAGEQLLP